jgi:hypothetical protein
MTGESDSRVVGVSAGEVWCAPYPRLPRCPTHIQHHAAPARPHLERVCHRRLLFQLCHLVLEAHDAAVEVLDLGEVLACV